MIQVKKRPLSEVQADVTKQELEQYISELEIDAIEREQIMSDLEIRIIELEQKIGG